MKIFILLIILLCQSFISIGQIDIDSEVKKKIESKIPKLCPVSQNAWSYLVFDINYNNSTVELFPDRMIQIPDSYDEVYMQNSNCSDIIKGWVEEFTMTTLTQKQISFSQSVSSTKTINLSFNIPSGLGTLGGSFVYAINNVNSGSTTTTTTDTRSRKIDVNVAPHKKLQFKLSRKISALRIPFVAKITFDGKVQLKPENLPVNGGIRIDIAESLNGCFNKTIEYNVSSILNEEERTFEFSGYLMNSKADEINAVFFESTPTEQDCSAGHSQPLIKHSTSTLKMASVKKQKITQRLLLGKGTKINDRNSVNISKFQEPVIEDYSESISISTSNSWACYWVRHKSAGPGFCEVTTTDGYGNSVSILAPPYVWSEWTQINCHGGEISTKITNSIGCDTGLLGSQVKYYKRN